jgi:hypothetical protein
MSSCIRNELVQANEESAQYLQWQIKKIKEEVNLASLGCDAWNQCSQPKMKATFRERKTQKTHRGRKLELRRATSLVRPTTRPPVTQGDKFPGSVSHFSLFASEPSLNNKLSAPVSNWIWLSRTENSIKRSLNKMGDYLYLLSISLFVGSKMPWLELTVWLSGRTLT